jgi:hypothetical protein
VPDWLKPILAKILFCNEYDLENVLLHIPVGMITVVISIFSPIVAAVFYYGFIKYETIERRQIRDKCFPDIQGSLYGLGFLAIILLIAGVKIGI